MIIFLDESGDAGFKLEQGSSTYFIIALVIFDSFDDAETTAKKVQDLRSALKLSPHFEFKFNKMSDYLRLQFLEGMRQAPFRVRAIVVDKRLLRSDTLRRDKEKFYSYFVKLALQHNASTISGAKLRVDGSGDRAFKRAFGGYLRKELGGILSDCKFRDSASDDLIQLADMIAGATRRFHDEDKQDKGFLERVRHKVQDIWEFE